MPTTEHLKVKPEKIVGTAVGVLEQELVLAKLVARVGVDQFKGALGDSVTYRVPGLLPSRTYEWRNDRSNPIVFDALAESKVSVEFGGHEYSAVKLTDEQHDFDLASWAELVTPQSRAVARGINRRVARELENAPYEVVIGDAEQDVKSAIRAARKTLNKFLVPQEGRVLVVGSDFEEAILADPEITLAQNAGDTRADNALSDAVIGRLYGFTVVVDLTIAPTAAYAFAGSAFILYTAAPSVPQSAPFGQTTSFEGQALRWIRDYETNFLQDRSVVDCYVGTDFVRDFLLKWNPATTGGVNGREEITSKDYFVRGIKLDLEADSEYPTGELATATGVSDPAAA